MRRTGLAVVLLVGSTFASAACGSSGSRIGNPPLTTPTVPHASDTRTAAVTRFTTIVAQSKVPEVRVFDRPDRPRPRLTIRSPELGGPLLFVVLHSGDDWLQVLLPVRPNGSSGWIRRGDVRLSQHDYRIVVELAAHRITVYEGATIVDRESVGVGKVQTPTPGGLYYTKQLLRPEDPDGIYGPFAYQLSGFSSVLTRFNGGTGVIGIHGTNEPWLIGKDVSHGCIRMSNAGITRLAHLLPLGVPVEIRP